MSEKEENLQTYVNYPANSLLIKKMYLAKFSPNFLMKCLMI